MAIPPPAGDQLGARTGGWMAMLTPAEAEGLRARGQQQRYRAGAVVYHEDDESDWVLILETGRVKASSDRRDGSEAILAILGAGEIVGELSALDGRPRSATITAIDAVRATVVEASSFREYLLACPRVAVLLLEMVGHRLRDTDRKRVEFGVYDTEARVSRRLIELVERFGQPCENGVQIDLPLTQEELAGWVGASRESVSKALRVMRARGWVETGRRRVIVRDVEALRRRAR